jgi:hypothetical protein
MELNGWEFPGKRKKRGRWFYRRTIGQETVKF